MYCKGMIQKTFTTNFNFSRAFHLLTLDKFFICLFFLMVDIFNISGAVLIAKQCKYFVVVKFALHLFALANFFSFNSLFLLLTGIVIINIGVLKKMPIWWIFFLPARSGQLLLFQLSPRGSYSQHQQGDTTENKLIQNQYIFTQVKFSSMWHLFAVVHFLLFNYDARYLKGIIAAKMPKVDQRNSTECTE